MNNQFTEIYKKLPTIKLLEIIANETDYQPAAIDAAKLELVNRQDIEDAHAQLKEKHITEEKQNSISNQKARDMKDKAYKAIEFADPLVAKTPERSVLILSILLLIVYLYKSLTSIGLLFYVLQNLSDIDYSAFIFLIEFVYLPITIFYFWRKSKTGWTMLLIWLVYQVVLDCFGLYMCYQLAGIDSPISRLMPMPNSSHFICMLLLHGALIYFICKPNIKILFNNTEPQITEEEI